MFDRWAQDTLPLAGEYFRAITKDLMWDNKLYNDTMSVGGRPAELSKIKIPILHAVAEHDHIVPYDAAKHLIEKIGSADKTEVILKVAMSVLSPARMPSSVSGPNSIPG
jgi:polyhydroxyalkanoate synthase